MTILHRPYVSLAAAAASFLLAPPSPFSSPSSFRCTAFAPPRGGVVPFLSGRGTSANGATTTTTTKTTTTTTKTKTTTTSLHAIGVLARKAKEAEVRKYCESGPEESTLGCVRKMRDVLKKEEEDGLGGGGGGGGSGEPGPMQRALTKRRGTITVIAEYKRRMDNQGYIDEVFDPEILSPTFREFNAAAIAVMADERIGGCTYDDVKSFSDEQRSAMGDMPGPCFVICSDLIVDEVQIARSKAFGADAVTVDVGVVGAERFGEFVKAARALEMEVIGQVSTREEAQAAVDGGATVLSVLGSAEPKEKYGAVSDLTLPEGSTGSVCAINHILARDNKALEEVEEAWVSRDLGFNAVWVADALYKNAAEPTESPGAVINAMRAKSSVKWASAKARSGKGEGAREYLGDIMM